MSYRCAACDGLGYWEESHGLEGPWRETFDCEACDGTGRTDNIDASVEGADIDRYEARQYEPRPRPQ